jgi:hypothetical protein
MVAQTERRVAEQFVSITDGEGGIKGGHLVNRVGAISGKNTVIRAADSEKFSHSDDAEATTGPY